MKRLLAVIIMLTLGVALGVPGASAGYDEGLAANARGDYAAALNEFLPPANRGAPDAQFAIALLYAQGHGVSQDFGEATRWCRLAAEQGNADAQHFLGIRYILGIGAPRSEVEAYKWFNLAAAQGHDVSTKDRDF